MLINQIEYVLRQTLDSLVYNFPKALGIVGVLWILQCINAMVSYRLNRFGIKTRSLTGLMGIVFAPFLHANFNHLFFNSIPLLVLIDLLMSADIKLFCYLTGWITLVSGLGIWIFGKKGIHIGASGLIMGYYGYLVTDAYFSHTTQAIILAVLLIYYFGGLLFSIIPQKKTVSWEGHLFGLLSGIGFALWLFYLR